jgi:hypothetical protein
MATRQAGLGGGPFRPPVYVNETATEERGVVAGLYLDETVSTGSVASGAAEADGAASVSGGGAAAVAGAGAAAGAASVAGAGVEAAIGAGAAGGSASVSGRGQVLDIVSGAGEADGSASVSGAGAGPTLATGAGEADGSAGVSGAGVEAALGAGEADGSSSVSGAGSWTFTPDVFPTLPGLGWPVHRRPTFRTIVAKHPSGGDVRTPLRQFPLWEFEVAFEALAASAAGFPNLLANSLQTLMGFFLYKGGAQNTFLFIDADFNADTAVPLGVGDGTTTQFLFLRRVGGSIEPVSWVVGVPTVYLNGVAQSDSTWSLVQPNVLAFNSDATPADGAVVTADVSYGFLCRFVDDAPDFNQMMWNLWEAKSIKFRQVLQT